LVTQEKDMRVLTFSAQIPWYNRARPLFEAGAHLPHEVADHSAHLIQPLALVSFRRHYPFPDSRTVLPITYPGDEKIYLARLFHLCLNEDFVDENTLYVDPIGCHIRLVLPEGTQIGAVPLNTIDAAYLWREDIGYISYGSSLKNHQVFPLDISIPDCLEDKLVIVRSMLYDRILENDCLENQLFNYSLKDTQRSLLLPFELDN